MTDRPDRPDDPHRADVATDQLVGRLLQGGVALSAVVLLLGWALFLARHGGEHANAADFHGTPAALSSVVEVIRGAASLRAPALMQLGIVLLVATPVARVALTLVAFLVRRDRIFALFSALVLLILLYGLFWSGAPL